MTIKETRKLARAVIKALKICAAYKRKIDRYQEKIDKERDIKLDILAEEVGLSLDQFCEEVETMSVLEDVDLDKS